MRAAELNATERILLVDDEPMVLHALQRQLRNEFLIHIAEGPEAGLKALQEDGPFAVVVSDMRMPRMSGVQFLDQVRQHWPETVRMMLTGNSDQSTAIDAVNRGQIYRFLNKPCPNEILRLALDSALAQYRSMRIERDLLSQTLNGSISLMSEVLAILSPMTFGRTAGIRRVAEQVAKSMPSIDQWEISAAAMLAFIGCITLDQNVLERYFRCQPLEPSEQIAVSNHPEIGARLIGKIPRLSGVAQIVRRQNEPYETTVRHGGAEPIGLCANILKAAIDLEWRITNGKSAGQAIVALEQDPRTYNPIVVKVLGEVLNYSHDKRSITLQQLAEGMILDEPLLSNRGDMLLNAGQTITEIMRERLLGIAASAMGVREPFWVRMNVQ